MKIAHKDHTMTEAIRAWALSQFVALSGGFHVSTFTIPADLGTAPNAMHGPSEGDAPIEESEAFYGTRGDRPVLSRLCDRAPRSSKLVTVIGINQAEPVIFTMYGGPAAPREPSDASMSPEERETARKYWAAHALSAGEFEVSGSGTWAEYAGA